MKTVPEFPAATLDQTIIVEWENVLLAGLARAQKMLCQLMEQTERYPVRSIGINRSEILIVYHEQDVPQKELVSALDECLEPGWDSRIRLIPSPTGDYYELKNIGASEARGAIIVFIDSDVLPEPDWLEELLAGFSDPDVQVVAGSSYLESGSLIEKTLALSWYFPLRPDTGGMRPAENFFANNLAFRRAVFLANPFPSISTGSRGSCDSLARKLQRDGIPIHQSLGARVCHPAPRGLTRLFQRGVAEGRDRLLQNRLERPHRARLFPSFARSIKATRRALRSILRDRSAVSLPIALVPGAILLALSYQLAMLLGDVLTRALPSMMNSHFRI